MSESLPMTTICLTGDIDYFNTETKDCLASYFSVLQTHHCKVTLFITAKAAEEFPERIEYIRNHHHEIEGHGDVHAPFYGSIPGQVIRLKEMKKIFSDNFGIEITGFRAPWYQHNRNTFPALREAGIKFDCSRKRFEVAFKRVPYVQKRYMYTPVYPFIKPVLRIIAALYNLYCGSQRYPFFIIPDVLEIPTLGISDYTLIDERNGPKFTPADAQKIGEIWMECLTVLMNQGGGVMTLQAHPGRVSPHYLAGLEYFIREATQRGAEFSTVENVWHQWTKKNHDQRRTIDE